MFRARHAVKFAARGLCPKCNLAQAAANPELREANLSNMLECNRIPESKGN